MQIVAILEWARPDALSNDHATVPQPLPRFYALIPCAGTGSRAGTERAQAVRAHRRPAHGLAHPGRLRAQSRRIARTAGGGRARRRLLRAQPPPRRWSCRCGGAHAGGTALPMACTSCDRAGATEHDWVLVHDAARCLVTPALIDTLIDACARRRGGRPAGAQAAGHAQARARAAGSCRRLDRERQVAGPDAADVPHRAC